MWNFFSIHKPQWIDSFQVIVTFDCRLNLNQGFSILTLLTFWAGRFLLWGCPVHCGTWSSNLGLYYEVPAVSFQLLKWEQSPDITKGSFGAKPSPLPLKEPLTYTIQVLNFKNSLEKSISLHYKLFPGCFMW